MSKHRYSYNTLKGMTKDELIKYIRACEHKCEILNKNLEQQAEILKTIYKDWEPIHHAEWLEINTNNSIGYKCSFCGRVESRKELYCNCGAKMDLEEK